MSEQSGKEYRQLGFKKREEEIFNSSVLVLTFSPFPSPNPILILPATVTCVRLFTTIPELPLCYSFTMKSYQMRYL